MDVLPEEAKELEEDEVQDLEIWESHKRRKKLIRKMRNKKTNVSLLQLGEFLHSFINRTKTSQYTVFVEMCPEEALGEADPFME